MDTAELTRWSALLAFLIYALALAFRLLRRNNVSRILWTSGCVVFLMHVFCAFQFIHHWSHAAAYGATARRTAEVVGLDWGGGIYANYAFTCVWLGDVCWWWIRSRGYESRARWLEWSVQAFLAFMWFNATTVFGGVVARWIGAAVCVLLMAAVLAGRWR